MSESQIILGNLELLRSLYDFKATFSKTLSFKENDYFILHQTNIKQRNWWQVINEKGIVGYVPSNYVQTVKVSPQFIAQFVDDCIENLQNLNPSNLIIDKDELIARLNEKRRQIELSLNNIEPSVVSTVSNDDLKDFDSTTYLSTLDKSEKSNSTLVPDLKYGLVTTTYTDDEIVQINAQDVYDLVESVRANTKLSHELSRVAVASVISRLQTLLPQSVSGHLDRILTYSQTDLSVGDNNVENTHDASRLRIIFNELTYCKEDSQQRSWMLHEDEGVITEYISELISILSNADPAISRHVFSAEQYRAVFTLVQYYQMETRWSIRQLLLQAFGVMCSLDATVIGIMLASVLPMELARDMLANQRNISKLNYSCLLLTMIFSMGDQMPITHLDILGLEFVKFILESIENPPDTDIDEQIPDLFLNFILAFNLQFTIPKDNVVLKALAERTTAKTFTEKILLLLNREEDPVRIFEHEPAPVHSLLKLFIDMFSCEQTAALFYTNDVKVLIDIMVRQLSDLSAGEKRRQHYLELCRLVMRNTKYSEHRHRQDDIHKCFTRILCEETEQSRTDQQIVKQITNEFPHYFTM